MNRGLDIHQRVARFHSSEMLKAAWSRRLFEAMAKAGFSSQQITALGEFFLVRQPNEQELRELEESAGL